jgi:hypothetical protein
MKDHYDAWTKASHRAVAVCNDCHTPAGLLPKYVTKARNGFWHLFYFALLRSLEVILDVTLATDERAHFLTGRHRIDVVAVDPLCLLVPDVPPMARELGQRVFDIQDRTFALRNQAMDVLIALVGDIKRAKTVGATDAQLEQARLEHRRGQFLLDFIEAENSMGFHAGSEAARVLAHSIDHLRLGQIAVRDQAGLR